jgi:hypothetical protein
MVGLVQAVMDKVDNTLKAQEQQDKEVMAEMVGLVEVMQVAEAVAKVLSVEQV